MTYLAARLTDPLAHAPGVLTGTVTGPPAPGAGPPVTVGGLPIAHTECLVTCDGSQAMFHPPLVPPFNPMIEGSATVLAYGKPVCRRLLDKAACGAVVWSLDDHGVFVGGGQATSARAVAWSLIDVVEPATSEDARLVVDELEKIPLAALEVLRRKGTRVAVCRGEVGKADPSLYKQKPRGHGEDADIGKLPGIYVEEDDRVIIATRGHDEKPPDPRVPRFGEDHGSSNLTIHETMHAVDHHTGGSNDPDFRRARQADKTHLPAYEQQDEEAGREETYAESAARKYGGLNDLDGMPDLYPNLDDYFEEEDFDEAGSGP